MKKLILFVFAFVMCKIGYAQYPMTQFIGTDSAIVVSKGAMQSRFVNVVFADTTAANSQRIRQYPGAMIYAAGKLWYRNTTATKWIELTSSSTDTNIYNSDGTLTGPRTLNGNNDDLTFDNMAYFTVGANPTGQVRFYQGSNSNILMRGDTTAISRRLSYNTNLGNTFTQYSLVDKNYVDSLAALGAGTVTSVATNNGTGITGGPITTSGTLSIDTTLISTRAWRQKGIDSVANLPRVTSVGLTMPVAFAVANSPITSSGTLAVTGAGLASQYIRGDGTLGDFPGGGGGGGSSVSYYLNGSVNQGTFGGNTYYEMNKTPVLGVGTDFSISANGYIAQFITDAGDPNLLNIPAGNWNLEFYFSASSGGGSPTFYAELYKYDGTNFTLIASNSASPELIAFGTTINPYFTALAVPQTTLALTDRLAIRIYVTHSGRTITLHTENSHLCQIITTFTTGLTALNGLTAQVQYLTTGTSGTDFNISSLTDTHTFNLPVASSVNTGKLSSTDWSTFNSKVGGSGTTNYIPKFTSSSAIGNSQIFDNGTSVGIGTTSPDSLFTVETGSRFKRGVRMSGLPSAVGTRSLRIDANGTLSIADTLTNGISGTGTSGQVAYWTGTNTQSGNNNLFWDNANGRLGIGTTSPGQTLTVNGDISLTTSQTIRWGSALGISKTLNQLLIYSGTGSGVNGGTLLHYWNGSAFSVGMQLTNNSNLILQAGGVTDGGQRLQVNGDALIKGSGNTSATTALTVQNSDGTNMLNIRNDGSIQIGSRGATQRPYFAGYTGFSEFGAAQSSLGIVTQFITATRPDPGILIKNSANLDFTSGTGTYLVLSTNYSPTSGTGTLAHFQIQPTINQTGGANGITRGLYIVPTLTAAADWRSIEWSNNSGWGLYGAGTAGNYLNGSLGIGATSLTGYSLFVNKSITGAAISFGISQNGSVLSDVTGAGIGYYNNLRTQAAAFTLSTYTHFYTEQGTIGAGSAVTTQRAFYADASLIGATTNLGFVGAIPSGTNRWNIYMSGTAANYMNGNLLLGSTVDGGQKLQVTGTSIFSGQSTITTTTTPQLIISYPSGASMRLTASSTANNFTILDPDGYGFTHGTSWGGYNARQTSIRLWTQATNTTTFQLGGQDVNPTVARTRTSIQPVPSSSVLFSPTSGTAIDYEFATLGNAVFSPTSGNATYTFLRIAPAYNTTGTYSGTVTGLIYNPTLTSLTGATHIAIQTVSGNVLFGTTSGSVGIGTSSPQYKLDVNGTFRTQGDTYLVDGTGSVGVNTTSIHASAIFEIKTTTKGFRPPVMTGAQAEAISSPAEGLMIYADTGNGLTITSKGWWGYDGSNWVKLN